MNNDGVTFLFSATLRIVNARQIHQEITERTGIKPTHCHTKGEIRSPLAKFQRHWDSDMWQIESPLPPDKDISFHLKWLWDVVAPHKEYFSSIIGRGFDVDVFCGYRSDSDTAGFRITPDALKIFSELMIPLEVSVIIHEME